MRVSALATLGGASIALGLACGGVGSRVGDDVAADSDDEVVDASCAGRCALRRLDEATPSPVIEAECLASCGEGDPVQPLRSPRGSAVVRGSLDVADLPANGLPLPVVFAIHLDDGRTVALSCEAGPWGGLIGRQVWTRGVLLDEGVAMQDGMIALRDCEGLATVEGQP